MWIINIILLGLMAFLTIVNFLAGRMVSASGFALLGGSFFVPGVPGFVMSFAGLALVWGAVLFGWETKKTKNDETPKDPRDS